jgi:hypothetical protein
MGFEEDSEREPLTPEQERMLMDIVLKRAPRDLAELEAASTGDERFYALPSAAVAAYDLERLDLAAALAREALETASKFAGDWNYGNAVHAGHSVLGLLALRAGDVKLSCEELEKSGATPGSPQLGSFGPSMQLARELLLAGETDAVLRYLDQCRRFWDMGATWINIWEHMIRAGSVPNFAMNRYR